MRCDMCLTDFMRHPNDVSSFCAQCDWKVDHIREQARAEGFKAGVEAAASWVEENVAVACDSVDTAAAIRDLAEAKP